MSQAFYKLVKNPVQFNLFLFTKLPAAFFSGVKLKSITAEESVVTIKYKWFATNPFRSTYFACLAMAAELSTGILAMAHVYKQNPAVSMLVSDMKGEFLKKATGTTTFKCADGLAFEHCILETRKDGNPKTVQATATGTDEAGNVIARFTFTWSLKRKI